MFIRNIGVILIKNRDSAIIEFVLFIRSITAGGIIGLCADVLSRNTNNIFGAILFGIGLVSICGFNLPLFTGKVGSENWKDSIIPLLVILLGNIIGAMGVFYILQLRIMLVLGFACGILVQIAVAMFKKGYYLITLLSVAAFILSGYMHCIAYVCRFDLNIMNFLLILIGNALGAKLAYLGGIRA